MNNEFNYFTEIINYNKIYYKGNRIKFWQIYDEFDNKFLILRMQDLSTNLLHKKSVRIYNNFADFYYFYCSDFKTFQYFYKF